MARQVLAVCGQARLGIILPGAPQVIGAYPGYGLCDDLLRVINLRYCNIITSNFNGVIVIGSVLWTALLITLCVVPAGWLPHWAWCGRHTDKFVHVMLFCGYGLLWTLASTVPNRQYYVLAVGIVLAVITELVQGIPGLHRSPDVGDLVADIVGLVIAVTIVAYVGEYQRLILLRR